MVVAAILACVAAGSDNVPDAIARAEALTTVRGSEDFTAIAASFKRIKNILRQAEEKQEFAKTSDAQINEALLIDPAEKELYAESKQLVARVERLRTERKYPEALRLIATLRPHVDIFFDKVMVMAPEPELRRNRLALIGSILREFSRIADFSEIVSA